MAPTTPVLDDFNTGASQLLTARAGWNAATIFSGNTALQTDSGPTYAASHPFSDAAWGTVLAADQECWVTFSGVDTGVTSLYARTVNLGGSVNGYSVSQQSANTWQLLKITASAGSPISAGVTQAISVGDSIGMMCQATTISSWYKAAAGSWTQLETATDATYSAPGQIGMDAYVTTIHFDSFAGGVIPSVGSLAGVNFERQGDRRN